MRPKTQQKIASKKRSLGDSRTHATNILHKCAHALRPVSRAIGLGEFSPIGRYFGSYFIITKVTEISGYFFRSGNFDKIDWAIFFSQTHLVTLPVRILATG
jgi:hypothetical protein